ncbi:hypothetical protein [Haloarcula amylovorans]|uniref:hypothetical protein n=1 Tax=Haloarcula amylovorans TaxID=2562280 RepID=UPI001076A18B|nr:hypothetical protein [Halomicroarcula amylolytica]
MLKQHLQSIQQWYSATDWNDALATAAVAWLFAIPGGAVAEYVGIAHVIRHGTVNIAYGWTGAAVMGVLAAMIAVPALLLSRSLFSRFFGRRVFFLPAVAVLAVAAVLSTALWATSVSASDEFVEFAHEQLLVGIVWWGLPLLTASLGLWLRDNRPQLRTGTTPTAALALIGVVVVAGAAAGMVAPADAGASGDSVSLSPNPQNASAYADGKGGPAYPFNSTRTDEIQLTDSEFTCSGRVHPPGVIPAEEHERTSNVTIERAQFEDGQNIPNRLWVNFDVPANSTVLEVRWGTLTGHTGYDTVSYDDEVSAGIISTEWDGPGFVSVTVVTENHTTERYWATLCPSQEVS